MSVDITQHEFQNDVAESLLSAPLVAQFSHEGNFGNVPYPEGSEGQESVFDDAIDLLNEGLEDSRVAGDLAYAFAQAQQQSPEDAELERQEHLVLSREERALRQLEREEQREPAAQTHDVQRQPEQRQPEPQTIAPESVTPQMVTQALQGLDGALTKLGFNEREDERNVVSQYCEATDSDLVNSEVTARTLNRLSVAALDAFEQCNGDFANVLPVHPLMAQELSDDFIRMYGVDPQVHPAKDPQLSANNLFFAALSIYATSDQLKTNDPVKIVNGNNAVKFWQNVGKSHGFRIDVDRAYAIKACRGLAQILLDRRDRINAYRTEQAQQKPARKSSGPRIPRGLAPGIRGSKPVRFQSNRDIFSGPGFEAGLRQQL